MSLITLAGAGSAGGAIGFPPNPGRPFPPGGGRIGDILDDIDPGSLLGSRATLEGARLEFQRKLVQTGTKRFTTIKVTEDGIIYDGHHGARAALELGEAVQIQIVPGNPPPIGPIGELPLF